MALGDILEQAVVTFELIESPLNSFVIALVILLSGFILGRIADRLLLRALSHASFDEWASRMFRARRNYERATRRFVTFALYVITVYLALAQLGLSRLLVAVVAFLFISIVLISAALGSLEVLPALRARSGLRGKGIGEGDIVRIEDPAGELVGRIAKVGMLELRLKRGDGEMIFYPLVALGSSPITKRRR